MTMIRATKRPVEGDAVDSYVLPGLRDSAVRRDARKLLAAADKRYTIQAGERLSRFARPALIAWSREDKFFPPRYAERLAEALPNVQLEWVDDAYTFSPEDQPGRLAELVEAFVRQPAPA
jgi:pimeloyl-ACP methyl ester carboxylesterase